MGIDLAHLADDAVGGDHGHVALDPVVGPLVDVEDERLIAAAGADGLSSQRLIDISSAGSPSALAGVLPAWRLQEAPPAPDAAGRGSAATPNASMNSLGTTI